MAATTSFTSRSGAPRPVLQTLCWSHGRRKLFELADIAESARRKAKGAKDAVISPIGLEAVKRIDAIFAVERKINGLSVAERLAVREDRSRPLVSAL